MSDAAGEDAGLPGMLREGVERELFAGGPLELGEDLERKHQRADSGQTEINDGVRWMLEAAGTGRRRRS